MHIIHKIFPTDEYDYTDNVETQFRPLPEVVAYNAYFVDLDTDLTPIGMKIYTTKTSCSTKILTTNLMTRSNVTT